MVLRREDEYVGKRVMAMEVPGKEGEKDQRRGGWIASRTTCRRDNCQGRTRKTGHNGGVTHRPHIKVGKEAEEEVGKFKVLIAL